MSNLPPFQTQYNKIIDAYFKDEIKPYDAEFCFCGNLCNNQDDWCRMPCLRHNDFMGYFGKDFVRMESALLLTIEKQCGNRSVYEHQEYENALFKGMAKALEILREIHQEHGEVTDEAPVFNKRILQGV